MVETSLVIPTFNRANILSKLLISITRQQTEKKFEVIVIDNGSVDETKNIVYSFLSQIKNLIYVYDDEPGLLTGRHRGTNEASGEVLCFLDDDVILNPLYVETVCELFKKGVNFATGPCLPAYEIEPPSWLNYFWNSVPEGEYCAWLSLLDFGDKQLIISPYYVWGLNFCIRKDTLISLGGFHPDCIPENLQQFQGDGETGLTQKAIKAGMIAIYEPNLSLFHHVSEERLTIEYFKKRAFYQGVCNSFTQLRNEYFSTTKLEPLKSRSIRDKLHPYYRWIKVLMPNKKTTPVEIEKIIETFNKEENEGYDFHQKRFKFCKTVKRWVLKENYFNYILPKYD